MLYTLPLCTYTHVSFFFFFNDTATTEIYTLSLHDALPILYMVFDLLPRENPANVIGQLFLAKGEGGEQLPDHVGDRKSTRLNSSHVRISYAVFCLKKKKNHVYPRQIMPGIRRTRLSIVSAT